MNQGTKYAIVIVGILIIVLVLFKIYDSYKDTNYRSELTVRYNNTVADVFDTEAKAALDAGRHIREPNRMDNYRMGTILLYNAADNKAAAEHFEAALVGARDDLQDADDLDFLEILFITDRIGDVIPDMEDIRVEIEAILDEVFEVGRERREEHKRDMGELKKSDPLYAEKKILSNQMWIHDPQNVHDKALVDAIAEQFKLVEYEQKQKYGDYHVAHNKLNTYDKAKTDILNRIAAGSPSLASMPQSMTSPQPSPEKLAEYSKVFERIEQNAEVRLGSARVPEKIFFAVIYDRCMSDRNVENREALLTALTDAVTDCVEGGHVVCQGGRMLKLWQCFAHYDVEPSVGVLRDKQQIRNEIYDIAAKIVNERLATLSEEDRQRFNQGESNSNIDQVKELIRVDCDALVSRRGTSLRPAERTHILAECLAAIE